MVQPNRQYSAGDYRYGFNGKEMDNEVKGKGAQYDYGFRIYDSRVVRFLSVDPLTKSYPWYTPYQFAGNKFITSIDLDGLEGFDFREKCEDDGSVKIFITTGRSVLDRSGWVVSTATGQPPTYHFKYVAIQEAMKKINNYFQKYSSGKETPENEDGFTIELPLSKYMKVNHTPALDRRLPLVNVTSIVFTLPPDAQELYYPTTESKGDPKSVESSSGWKSGNAQFSYNTELTSGQVTFKYDNDFVKDQYIFTDADGNEIYKTQSVNGKGEISFEFHDLKSPVINIKVISSDKGNPSNSVWIFDIKIDETDKQKQERRDKQSTELPCTTK